MAWTMPTAFFFVAVALLVAGMTVWELRSPTGKRRGWLPLVTTRGDRLFISLLVIAVCHIVWLAVTDANPVWASTLSLLPAAIIWLRG